MDRFAALLGGEALRTTLMVAIIARLEEEDSLRSPLQRRYEPPPLMMKRLRLMLAVSDAEAAGARQSDALSPCRQLSRRHARRAAEDCLSGLRRERECYAQVACWRKESLGWTGRLTWPGRFDLFVVVIVVVIAAVYALLFKGA